MQSTVVGDDVLVAGGEAKAGDTELVGSAGGVMDGDAEDGENDAGEVGAVHGEGDDGAAGEGSGVAKKAGGRGQVGQAMVKAGMSTGTEGRKCSQAYGRRGTGGWGGTSSTSWRGRRRGVPAERMVSARSPSWPKCQTLPATALCFIIFMWFRTLVLAQPAPEVEVPIVRDGGALPAGHQRAPAGGGRAPAGHQRKGGAATSTSFNKVDMAKAGVLPWQWAVEAAARVAHAEKPPHTIKNEMPLGKGYN